MDHREGEPAVVWVPTLRDVRLPARIAGPPVAATPVIELTALLPSVVLADLAPVRQVWIGRNAAALTGRRRGVVGPGRHRGPGRLPVIEPRPRGVPGAAPDEVATGLVIQTGPMRSATIWDTEALGLIEWPEEVTSGGPGSFSSVTVDAHLDLAQPDEPAGSPLDDFGPVVTTAEHRAAPPG